MSTFVFSLMVTAMLLPALRALAIRHGLVDTPSERKRHAGSIPLVGGIAMFLGILVQTLLFNPGTYTLGLLGFGSLLVITGVFDDRFSINPAIRALLEFVVIVLVALSLDIYVAYLGQVLGDHVVVLSGIWAIIFTAFAVIGVINAINMADGVDGLLGSIALVTVLAMAVLLSGNATFSSQLQLCMAISGALFAFLLFNLPAFGLKMPVFMGDGGSIFLGFVIALLLVSVTQGPNAAFEPVVAGWLVGLPLLDTISVIVRRISHGQSPLTGGRDHLHHQLLDFGLSSGRTVFTMVSIHLALVTTGVVAHLSQYPDALFFWGFVALTIGHYFLTPRLLEWLSLQSVGGH